MKKRDSTRSSIKNASKQEKVTLLNQYNRADTTEKPVEIGKSPVAQKTCVSDAIRLWNIAPEIITKCSSLSIVKSEIKKYVRQLPI